MSGIVYADTETDFGQHRSLPFSKCWSALQVISAQPFPAVSVFGATKARSDIQSRGLRSDARCHAFIGRHGSFTRAPTSKEWEREPKARTTQVGNSKASRL